MTLLAWIATAVFVGIPWAALLYLLVVEPLRLWLRHRRQESIEPSPLMQEINEWLGAKARTFERQSIFEVPTGRTRLGLNAPARPQSPGAETRR